MQIVQKFLILFTFSLIIFSCSRDRVEEVSCDEDNYPTYSGEIRSIINTTCAYTGCHVNGTGYGDYTNFQSMEADFGPTFLDQISTNSMPPSYAEGPKELSASELLAFQCWIQGGYLEN